MEQKLALNTKLYNKLSSAIESGRLFHANMIVGADYYLAELVIKQIAAKILSQGARSPQDAEMKTIKGVHPDLFEFGKEKPIDVQASKTIIEKVQVSPYEGDNKVIIIYNFDRCTQAPMNKLLKTLEEPPRGTYFFLVVENENRVLQTILSRTQKFYVDILSDTEILNYAKIKYPTLDNFNLSSIAGGSLTKLNSLAESGVSQKIYDFVMDTFLNYNKTSQFGIYSKKIDGVKTYIKEVLEIFASLASKAIRLRIGRASITRDITNITDAGKIASSWPFKALVLVVDATVKAQEMLDKNATVQNVMDQFLFKILEVKIKCRR